MLIGIMRPSEGRGGKGLNEIWIAQLEVESMVLGSRLQVQA